MKNFLLGNLSTLLWVITAVHLGFMVILLKKFKDSKYKIFLLAAIITFGLFYDALFISLGAFIKGGSIFKGLSQLRFVFHGVFIPLLFPICAEALGAKDKTKKIVWGITAFFIAFGLAESFCTVLDGETVANVFRYKAGDLTPKWATIGSLALSIGSDIPLMVCGLIALKKKKNPFLFLSGFFMFAISAAGASAGELMFFTSMFGEVLMILFMILFGDKDLKKLKAE